MSDPDFMQPSAQNEDIYELLDKKNQEFNKIAQETLNAERVRKEKIEQENRRARA